MFSSICPSYPRRVPEATSPPCLVARAGRKHFPVSRRSPKTNDALLTCGNPHSGQERAYALLVQWAKKNVGALVANMTGEARRVAKSPPVPWEEVSQIRHTKYVDSSHSQVKCELYGRSRVWDPGLHCVKHFVKAVSLAIP